MSSNEFSTVAVDVEKVAAHLSQIELKLDSNIASGEQSIYRFADTQGNLDVFHLVLDACGGYTAILHPLTAKEFKVSGSLSELGLNG